LEYTCAELQLRTLWLRIDKDTSSGKLGWRYVSKLGIKVVFALEMPRATVWNEETKRLGTEQYPVQSSCPSCGAERLNLNIITPTPPKIIHYNALDTVLFRPSFDLLKISAVVIRTHIEKQSILVTRFRMVVEVLDEHARIGPTLFHKLIRKMLR
jgi:hypothetical protein